MPASYLSSPTQAVHGGLTSVRQGTCGPGPVINLPTWVVPGVGRRVSQNSVSTEQGNRESFDGSHWVSMEAGKT